MVRHDIVGTASIDFRWIAAKAFAAGCFKADGEIGRRDNGVSAFFGIAPGMSTISGDDDGKIAASRPRSGERAVRKSGLIGESGDLALRRLLDQAGGGGGANLLITVYDDFITQATGKGTRLECCEGSEH